jgi:hypothetical protein
LRLGIFLLGPIGIGFGEISNIHLRALKNCLVSLKTNAVKYRIKHQCLEQAFGADG